MGIAVLTLFWPVMEKLDQVTTAAVTQYASDRLESGVDARLTVLVANGSVDDVVPVVMRRGKETYRVESVDDPITGFTTCTLVMQLPKFDLEPIYRKLSRHFSPEEIATGVTSMEAIVKMLKIADEKDQMMMQ